MFINTLEPVVGQRKAEGIFNEISAVLGLIQNVERVSGGLVHHVFKITGTLQTAYLKLRGEEFARIPEIKTKPELISVEKKALDLFAKKSKEYFPRIILYSSVLHYLLLSDVMPGGETLDKRFAQNNVGLKDLRQFGRTLGKIHVSNAQFTEPVRFPDDKQYQGNLLQYALEKYEHPLLISTARELKHESTQLLIGDLSPKNIYLKNEQVRFCDLENAHQGALTYDQAFVIAHILLHHETKDAGIAAMWSFLDGYKRSGNQIDTNDKLLCHTLHGILLYRLVNTLIPYALPFNDEEKIQMSANVFSSLDNRTCDLEAIASNLFWSAI